MSVGVRRKGDSRTPEGGLILGPVVSWRLETQSERWVSKLHCILLCLAASVERPNEPILICATATNVAKSNTNVLWVALGGEVFKYRCDEDSGCPTAFTTMKQQKVLFVRSDATIDTTVKNTVARYLLLLKHVTYYY